MVSEAAAVGTSHFEVNGISYNPSTRPIVVLCIDGGDCSYFERAREADKMPHFEELVAHGFSSTARGCLPSFTNVNNAAIVTGTPPSVTGISGNYFLDQETGQEVMMNAASFLRADTILAAAARNGRRSAVVTAKDKLRHLLSKNLNGIAISAEAGLVSDPMGFLVSVDAFTPVADIYTAEASLFVLRSGVDLLERGATDFCYLTTTDFVQHRYPPEAEEALEFYAAMDAEIARLMRCDAVIGITADHGMNDKTGFDGKPNIIFLEELLLRRFGSSSRVICPVTDPYTVHHASLGGAVMVYVDDERAVTVVAGFIRSLRGIEAVLTREEAKQELELPPDRIGDLVVLAEKEFVIGKDRDYHDLTVLKGPLRSHGGRAEETVPFIVSEPLSPEYGAKAEAGLRNYDIFAFCCNGVDAH